MVILLLPKIDLNRNPKAKLTTCWIQARNSGSVVTDEIGCGYAWNMVKPCLFFFVLSSRADLASVAAASTLLLLLLVDEAWGPVALPAV